MQQGRQQSAANRPRARRLHHVKVRQGGAASAPPKRSASVPPSSCVAM